MRSLLCLSLLVVAGFAPAAAPPRAVSFRDDVFPILGTHCLRCHQGTNPTSAIRLDARSELLGESNGRPLVRLDDASKSRLLASVRGHDVDKTMPPPGRGKRLSETQIDILRAWISQGLAWDERLIPSSTSPAHRFFTAASRPPVPAIQDVSRIITPIDAFLADAWRGQGLRPVSEAPKRVLIRRLYLDLIGLPPSPEAIDDFDRDSRPDAYERVVDTLLSSPRYGERWGRHWLDVGRYADSEGYESNHPRAHAWRYRDWVVRAFNADLPYRDFIRLQLAGDEVKPYADDNLIATGFLAAARLSSNEEDRSRQRNDILVDVVNTTAGAFLGLTFHCAQCHNHKFDPITARDYYRFQAFFQRGQPGNLALRDGAVRKRWRASLPEGYEAAITRVNQLFDAARERLVAGAITALTEEERIAYALDPAARTPEQETLARRVEDRVQFGTGAIVRAITGGERKEYDALEKRLAEWSKSVAEEPQTFGFLAPATASAKIDVLPMKGFYPLYYQPRRLGKLRAHLLVAGDVHQRGPALEPGWPAVFGPTPTLSPTPRQALADWLASPTHPLTARVWVNRLWQWHFGRGLVASASDFGVKGAAPTHPELLDWLAAEFTASGGSTKHIHRLIVRSAAYRLAATPNAANAAIDGPNAYLWRWTPRRGEAEVIRDSLLEVSGDLDSCMGGPGDADEVVSRRRGVYLNQRRDHPPMLQGLFDGPVASAEPCPLRSVSTVPLHALFLLNNRFPRDRARSLATLVQNRAGDDRERQVAETFRLALGRMPSADEQRQCQRFFDRVGEGELAAFCQVVLNLNEFLYVE